VQHADDGYSRRGNFGGSLVAYLPEGTNVYGSRGGKFEPLKGMGQSRGLKVVKSSS